MSSLDPHLFHRARPPEFSTGLNAVVVTRYDDLRAVLDDPETFSSTVALPRIYANAPEVVAVLERGGVPEVGYVVDEDEPGHTPVRRVFDAGFTGARVRATIPSMHATAEELIDAFDVDGADLVADYAVPFVQRMIGAVIGFPPEDAQRIQRWTDAQITLWNPMAPRAEQVDAAERMVDYTRYLQDLIDDRRADPRDDLVTDLVHGANGHPGLPDDHVHCVVRGAARVAGFETTRDAITSTVLAVLAHPEIRERVLADPAKAIPRVTEEVLRRDAPHRGLFRLTTTDTRLGGIELAAGTVLLLLFGSGNRDETVFPDPDVLDLDRPNVRRHLAFGHGLHMCPGKPMALAEIRVALEHLFRRLPGLRVADGYEPVHIGSYVFRGLRRLDVTW